MIAAAILLLLAEPGHGRGEAPSRAPNAPTVSAARGTSACGQGRTREVQAKLASYGYTIVVDGDYGPQTTRVVKHWQRANGLYVDGCAGPDTVESLDLDKAVTASVPAVRVTPPASRVPSPGPVGDVEAIIRDVWPDDIEDWAVRIAKRESSLVPTAANWCCHGLFQIHWTAHRAWLTSDFGITQASQLYDPRVNATVALALYQAAGPGPWDL